jgi:predicted acyl esterase
MSEDQQLRVEAVRLAVKALESCSVEMEDIVKMATDIYTFISGEKK